MRALIIPGQGPHVADSLSVSFPQKLKWIERAEEVLGQRITEQNIESHDVNSAFIVATALACHERYLSQGYKTESVAGYSVGQIAALAVAGVLSPEGAIDIAIQRARIMQEHTSSQFSMLAVLGISLPDLQEMIDEVAPQQSDDAFISICNLNAPQNYTLGGNRESLERLFDLAQKKEPRKIEFLNLEGAWHSRMLNSAVPQLKELIDSHKFSTPQCLFFDNVTAKSVQSADEIRENLCCHLTHSVRWEESIRNMISLGATEFYECGCAGQLPKFLFFIDRKKKVVKLDESENEGLCAA